MTKHYVVVGGTRGAGRTLVDFLCSRGRRVSVLARTRPRSFPENALFLKTDICEGAATKRQLQHAIRTNGSVNYLVFFQRYRGNGDSWEGELNTSLTASRNIIKQLSDAFASRGDRAIVFVGSVAAQFVLPEQEIGYHVAKAGLIQMMRYYAMALGPRGIRVNCVSLGTMLKEEAMQFYAVHPEVAQRKAALSPLGRMGQPDDVVHAIEFLCSTRASFITGHNLLVDGGITLVGHETLAQPVVDRIALRLDDIRL